jgi:ribokinase
LETVIAASHFGKGRTFILNPAPARELPDELLSRVDFLTPNETEAEVLTGILPADEQSCLSAARVLIERGVKNVLFTLGARGSFLANDRGGRHFPSVHVEPVDTTGAGDAFNGAFAHFLAQGEPVERAIHFANVAGALSTTKPGAQASMPSLSDVLSRALSV